MRNYEKSIIALTLLSLPKDSSETLGSVLAEFDRDVASRAKYK